MEFLTDAVFNDFPSRILTENGPKTATAARKSKFSRFEILAGADQESGNEEPRDKERRPKTPDGAEKFFDGKSQNLIFDHDEKEFRRRLERGRRQQEDLDSGDVD